MTCTLEQVAGCIRAERARRGWTREKLSQESGIPVATIGAYENAENRITLENAWKIADAFGMSLGTLYGRDETTHMQAS